MEIETQVVETIEGQPITQIRLMNDQDVEATFLTLGATWQSFLVPTATSEKKNLVLGFERPSDYLKNSLCAGQSIGRVAGRIDGGKAKVGGKEIQLPQNEKGNCLHGGFKGFHKQVWHYETYQDPDAVSVKMTYLAKEAVDGFPGDMTVEVNFTLDNTNKLDITYHAYNITADTLFNPTSHVYFNLSRHQHLKTQSLTLQSDAYLESREDVVPTGKVLAVEGTGYDFRTGQNLEQALERTGGLDDAFIVSPSLEVPQVTLKDTESGDCIKMYSDRNAFVVYTMNSVESGVYPSRDAGQQAKAYEAIALEAQTLPDAINHEGFGDIMIKQGNNVAYTISCLYSNSIDGSG